MKLNARNLSWLLLAFCLFLLGTSYLLQYGFHLKPCPLCLIDRGLIILIVFFLMLACYHQPRMLGWRIYSAMVLVLATGGILVTGRHLWLLQLPANQAPACGPGIKYLLQNLPFTQAIEELLLGSGECAQQKGGFLGLSLPGWTMIAFITVVIGALLLFWKANELNNDSKK